ncbi:hypothetical protein evm_013952 [Chilo suppressalis]|nr:hypothetical protein evm_013952 [Chilo suppressalis]
MLVTLSRKGGGASRSAGDKAEIKRLVEEKPQELGRGLAALKGGLSQLAPLFQPPHLNRFYNLYVDQLVRELSGMHAGCSIDGVNVNNISYANDMVLLSPSISALRSLLHVCETYAKVHGLKYNTTKSEIMVFTAGNNSPQNVPPVRLCGEELLRVQQYRYLGHILTEDLKDDQDIERERRALAVRSNMIARRFARSSEPVKLTLFKAFCQSFYTGSLWVSYKQKTYNALRVQYNNAFRMLLGLPWRCSASGMFAEARTNDFYAIMRKKVTSLMKRVYDSHNNILKVVGGRYECPISNHWTTVLVKCNEMQ